MVFGEEETGTDIVLTRQTKFVLILVPIVIGIISICFLCFLLFSTMWGDIRGTMKTSEKFLLYNVIVPDMILAFYILGVVAPATYRNSWKYEEFGTTWMGFLFMWSVLHAPLAMGCICSLIAVSYQDANRYDALNKESRMLLLCAGYAGVSCCLCSLPATERKGFRYDHFWFHPTSSVYEGYGGIFTLLSTTSINLIITMKSLRSLSKEKAALSERKVTKKYVEDLNLSSNFMSLCLTMSFLMPVPLVMPIENHFIVLPIRCALYLGPICRVLLLTRTCPLFKFVTSSDTDEALLSEFAELSALIKDN